MPGLSPTPGRADAAAGETRLPLADALIASEQAERLVALQDAYYLPPASGEEDEGDEGASE